MSVNDCADMRGFNPCCQFDEDQLMHRKNTTRGSYLLANEGAELIT
jgi:hypothetical protein